MTTPKELSASPPPVEDAELERLMDVLVKLAGYHSSFIQREELSAARRELRSYVSRRVEEARGEALVHERRRILAGLSDMDRQQASRELAMDAMGELE